MKHEFYYDGTEGGDDFYKCRECDTRLGVSAGSQIYPNQREGCMKNFDYKPFDGDGREKAGMPSIAHNWPGRPLNHITNAVARKLIDTLVECRTTHHSSQGGTLWVEISWCQHNHRMYSIDTYYDERGAVMGYSFYLRS